MLEFDKKAVDFLKSAGFEVRSRISDEGDREVYNEIFMSSLIEDKDIDKASLLAMIAVESRNDDFDEVKLAFSSLTKQYAQEYAQAYDQTQEVEQQTYKKHGFSFSQDESMQKDDFSIDDRTNHLLTLAGKETISFLSDADAKLAHKLYEQADEKGHADPNLVASIGALTGAKDFDEAVKNLKDFIELGKDRQANLESFKAVEAAIESVSLSELMATIDLRADGTKADRRAATRFELAPEGLTKFEKLVYAYSNSDQDFEKNLKLARENKRFHEAIEVSNSDIEKLKKLDPSDFLDKLQAQIERVETPKAEKEGFIERLSEKLKPEMGIFGVIGAAVTAAVEVASDKILEVIKEVSGAKSLEPNRDFDFNREVESFTKKKGVER